MDEFQEIMAKERAGKKTVAIVGMAESSRELAPWDDPSVSVWVMNESAHDKNGKGSIWLKRFDRLFQMHPKWDYSRPDNHNDPTHWEWLKSIPGPGQEGHFPIYMLEVDPEVPASVEYPWEQIVARFLPNYRRIGQPDPIEYATSTAEYMLALAALEGFQRAELYGIEMASKTEYGQQRDGGTFWLAVLGQHMEVILPANCSLLKAPLYGYDKKPTLNAMLVEVRIKGMYKEYQKFEAAHADLVAEKATNEKEQKTFRSDLSRMKAIRKRAEEIDGELDALAGRMNILRGHIDEAQFFYDKVEQLDASIARALHRGESILGQR